VDAGSTRIRMHTAFVHNVRCVLVFYAFHPYYVRYQVRTRYSSAARGTAIKR